MATSQVEIASSSPFGRNSACFQNNLVNDKSHRIDLWVHRQTTPANNDCDNVGSIHHKDKWARAREMVLRIDHGPTKGCSVDFNPQPEDSNLGGVSSLVQKWKGLQAAKGSINNTTTKFPDNTTTNNNVVDHEDVSFRDHWEFDRTAFSGPPSSRSRDSDATEIERIRVADIIKKWTDNDIGCDSPPRVKISSEQTEQHRCSPVLNSPRIRGRHAFNDLLVQMERDRHKEIEGLSARNVVSKFSHRGRIQALLRFRLLRRGMETKEEGCQSTVKPSQTQKVVQPPAMPISERDPCAQKGSVSSGRCQKEQVYNISTPPMINQHGNENRHNVINMSPRSRRSHIQNLEGSVTSEKYNVSQSSYKMKQEIVCLSHNYENLDHGENPFSKLIRHETNWDNNNHSLTKSARKTTTFHTTRTTSGDKTEWPHTSVDHKQEDDTSNHATNYDPEGDFEEPPSYYLEEPTSNQNLESNNIYLVSDVSDPNDGWELQSDNQQQEGTNIEWIGEVSRPRSDWEGLRQARYQEMLDPFLDNKEEIRMLLGRRSVSTFLSSGLREQIDRVMISRSQGQQMLKNHPTQEEKHNRFPEQEVISESQKDEGEEVQDYNDNFDEYEEVESSIGQQYSESGDYTDQTTSSPPESSPQNHGHESSDYSCQVSSPSTRRSSSNYYSQESRPSSSTNVNPTIDMKLIHDLRGDMEQLHREMSELRKSIKCCMDMQFKLQHFIEKKVTRTMHHSEVKNGRLDAMKKATNGGRCCVCCKMQVDSLLYRCGHMCTCFKCAHKLHWSSGKCPICRAPILDVVRTYYNHT